ncbi:FK506-binding protein 5-like isoform X7 [Saccostrea cucullata]|uniref:FK506-binding protein 5-like isoform X7 n=1 Tax=Saccostrea cuccullata TaxID=36930 RepID=UPI002ED500C8
MSLDYDVSDNSGEEFGADSCGDTSSYHGSCELSDSQEDLCNSEAYRRMSDISLTDSRAMSLTKKGPEPGGGPLTKKIPPQDFRSNGGGHYPLSYHAEPPDDENMNEIVEEDVEVFVHLPDGGHKKVAVNSNIPMMDLLVNLAAGSRLNPGGHTLQVLNEDTGKLKQYKPNQTIGSLCTRGEDHKFQYVTVQIVPKKDSKKSAGNNRNVQPFEMTKRFTVNLPGGQKKVLRISPQSTLEQVRAQLCQERQINPSQLVFQLPNNPRQQLGLQTTIAELPTTEVNLISANVMLDGAKSMPDLSVGRSQSMKTDAPAPYMPMAGEGKKKKGFFSFLKKDKKFTVSMHADLNHAGKAPPSSNSQREGGSPPTTRRKFEAAERPKSMFVTSSPDIAVNGPKTIPASSSDVDIRNRAAPSVQVKPEPTVQVKSAPALQSVKDTAHAGPPVKSGKKKRAPPPPQVKAPPPQTNVVTTEIVVEKQTMPSQAESRIPEITSSNQQLAQKLHSRNSSDSSGYHELTLSGAESPDTAKIEENLELQLNADITSGGGLKNSGDSGIRDMSSPRRKVRPGIETMDTGSSQTLPLDKVGKKEVSRTRSLERPSGAKKKKAPPPPPEDDTVAIHAVLDDLDNHLGDDLEEDQMMMVENRDLTVEEVDQQRSLRPCAFVAPPPPDEPPPEDGEIVRYSDIMGVKVDTVDIGTETSDDSASFDQGSPKSSPKFQSGIRHTMHSRAESRTSMTSVTTIDEINMGFEMAILAGQEAMLEESSEEDEEEYKNEMAHFVERMNKEVINQKVPESIQSEPDSESRQKISVEEVKLDLQSSSDEGSAKPSPRENKNTAQREQEVSEITYSFTVDAVPPEFQENEEVKGQKNENEEEEEEEEYTETITTEVLLYPLSSSDGPESPRKIPDLDSPKEHAMPVVPVEKPKETEKVKEEIKEKPPVQKVDIVKKVQETKVAKTEEKPKVKQEKEEFVLTFDDLQNVDFTGPKKKKPQTLNLNVETKAKPAEEVKRRSGRKSPAVVTSPVLVLEELRSRFKSDGDENVLITPLKESRNGSIKDRCNELSFTPSSEGEQEHVMEEKSISFMNFSVVRSSDQVPKKEEKIVIEKLDLSKDVTDGVSGPVNSDINEDSVNNNESAPNSARDSVSSKSSQNSARDSLNNNDSAPNSARDSVASIEQEIDPLGQMQQQFQIWQTQLEQNQNLLASQPVPTDENSLQLQNQLKSQIEIQKQMLAQMQKSMETLAAQAQTKPTDSPRNSIDKTEVSSRQDTIPSPPVMPQMRMKSDSLDKEKKSKRKSSKRFEPKLDPREELMLQIRNFQGRGGLKKVPVKKTKWVSGPGVNE